MVENTSSPGKEGKSYFLEWLKSCSLEKYYQAFTTMGISEIGHLEDIQEEDALALRLSHIEFRRLTRMYGEYKQQQARKSSLQEKVSPTAFRPSSSSTVVALPKGMKGFFQTRDGLGNVLVSTNSLKRQFKNLECELWCRKERAKRNDLLIAFAKSPVIDQWTPYYKKQSVYGLLQINELKYPQIVALKSSSSAPRHSHYEHLCKFVEGCEDALGMAKAKMMKCKQEMDATLKDGSTGKQIREG
ncbi:unnamed protein product [Porites lobata]|uniref:non-specific protein-tyrosine kinase n=1 Tax=Porites lobata TaxID=104759 RepID=A0ABN8P9X3_9CNID|nr:unnamed protein product [Porites lobata]